MPEDTELILECVDEAADDLEDDVNEFAKRVGMTPEEFLDRVVQEVKDRLEQS